MYSQRDIQNFHNHIASVLNVYKEIEQGIKEFVTGQALHGEVFSGLRYILLHMLYYSTVWGNYK